MKKILLCLAMLLVISCSSNNSFKVGMSTNILDKSTAKTIENLLEESSITTSSDFIKMVHDYNKEKDNGCGIKKWRKTNLVEYDDYACIERYEKNNKVSDGNCRITAYLLTKDLLTFDKLEKEAGTYLMLDMDVLENNKAYQIVKDEQNKFITLYNEIDINKVKDDLVDVFPNKWKEYNIKIDEGNISIISVVMHDPDFDLLFVGHTGVLINMGDKYLFIEKIAFEEPYQFTVIKNKKELKDLFKKRNNYFGDGNEQGPVVYENDVYLFSLK